MNLIRKTLALFITGIMVTTMLPTEVLANTRAPCSTCFTPLVELFYDHPDRMMDTIETQRFTRPSREEGSENHIQPIIRPIYESEDTCK